MSLNGKAAIWSGRALSALVIAFMVFDGGVTVMAFDFVTKGMAEFGFPVEYARPLGATMLICTLLYALPQTAVLGAILLTGFLGGTIVAHMPRPEPLAPHIVIALVMGALVWAGIWLRDPRLQTVLPLRQS